MRICETCKRPHKGRTKDCGSCRVIKLRNQRRITLILENGKECKVCGYSKCYEALCFHHRDPKTKCFQLNKQAMTKPMELLRLEAKKCDLMCCRCHTELHVDVAQSGRALG